MRLLCAAYASLALGALSLLHAAWAAGSTWPARDREQLALRVIGLREMPSRAMCAAVALGLALMAVVVLAPSPSWIRLAVAVIFLVRGTFGFFDAWRGSRSVTPYARLNRSRYTLFALSVGIAILLTRG